MTHEQTPAWQIGVEGVIDAVLAGHDWKVARDARSRIGNAVADSISAMPQAQRLLLQRLLAGRFPGRGRRQQGTWLLETDLPGVADVGHALTALVWFHAWSELADSDG